MKIRFIEKLIDTLINSPFYPHWLEWKKGNEANLYILKSLHGKIIEVGAGDGSTKIELLKKYKKITKYIATDYSSWDEKFKKVDRKVDRYRHLSVLWSYKKRAKMDNICSAEKLPYKNNFFDYHLSFEVLEHIQNPDKFFKEAARVIKRGGKIIVAYPFLYRMHGGEPKHKLDFYRYTNGFFYFIAQKNNLKLKKIYSNTGYGTTFASLTNQWLIQRIYESKLPSKIPFIIFSPFIFAASNIIGLMIDKKPDIRFATRFYIILEKK